jgi:hypothetical protein
LSSEQKSQLKTLRAARTDTNDSRQAAQLLTRLLASASLAQVTADSDAGEDENNQNAGNEGNPNRNHGALKKPKRG